MNQNETKPSPQIIVFFDGYCNLCSNSVDWLIAHDKARLLKYSSLQGETAKSLLSSEEISAVSSIVVVADGGIHYRESKAAFFLLKKVESGLKFLLVFSVLPALITDFFYQLVAKNRYFIFGKRDTCRLPTPEEKSYFLP